MSPDERTFRAHLKRGAFQAGVSAGRWRLIRIEWPHALIAVSAADRKNGPEELVLRFELTGYPNTLPTSVLWDIDANAVLAEGRRPQGERATLAFRHNWESLYIPCDRKGIVGHGDWATVHPEWMWNETKGIALYLQLVHELLNEDACTGV